MNKFSFRILKRIFYFYEFRFVFEWKIILQVMYGAKSTFFAAEVRS